MGGWGGRIPPTTVPVMHRMEKILRGIMAFSPLSIDVGARSCSGVPYDSAKSAELCDAYMLILLFWIEVVFL